MTEEQNYASLSRQFAQAEAETARLRRLLSIEATRAAALEAVLELGPVAKMIAPLVQENCHCVVDDRGVKIKVIGDDGRPRFIYANATTRLMTPSDLLTELKRRPEVRRLLADQNAPDADVAQPKTVTNRTEEMRKLSEQAKKKTADELRATCRDQNPFAAATFNLTQQARLTKTDPQLAARLRREAAA